MTGTTWRDPDGDLWAIVGHDTNQITIAHNDGRVRAIHPNLLRTWTRIEIDGQGDLFGGDAA